MTDKLIVRIDKELKRRVSNLARLEGKSLSGLIRELLEDYSKRRNISDYIDNLWNEIGRDLEEKGVSESDIDSAIEQARKDND